MAERGFVRDLNLREINRAGQANTLLVNLSRIDGITDDIRLFSNNLSNFSTLPKSISVEGEDDRVIYVIETDSDGDSVVVLNADDADGYFGYSNRTILYDVNQTTSARRQFTQAEADELEAGGQISSAALALGQEIKFEVYESNGVNRFKVKDQYGINRSVTGNLVRPDRITFKNLQNMAVDRELTITDALSTGEGDVGDNIGIIADTITNNYSEINNGLSLVEYKKSRLPLGYQETFLTRRAAINGFIAISNPDNIDVTNAELDPPGLYIQPPGDGEPIRAFSDTSNPWSRDEANSRLQTTSSKITVNRLTVNNPNLQPQTAAQQHQSEANTLLGDDNYKIKVTINGVPHFLFAKLDAS